MRGVAFPSEFIFGGIADILHVNFEHATFGDFTDFRSVTFGGLANFFGTKYGSFANFSGATFGNQASFDDATFGDGADFSATTFGDLAYFTSAIFGDYVSFEGATFEGRASFISAAFGTGANFKKVDIFDESSFSANKPNNSALDLEDTNFSNAVFTGPVSFENRAFVTSTDFNGAVFHDLVEFHGCTFHPGMPFHKSEFLKTKGVNDDATEALERSYRTLKLEMEKLRARNEEADFFALEMECRRQRGSVPWLERFAATLYKHLSDYGRSVARPLVWLGFLLGYGFAYFYHLAQAKSFHVPGDVLRFVVEQITIPFSVWRNEYKCDPWMVEYLKEQPLLLRAPATLMTLTAIALAALFLLALRRRFKMD